MLVEEKKEEEVRVGVFICPCGSNKSTKVLIFNLKEGGIY